MFIARLPAGYLLARTCPRLPAAPLVLGSVLPDLDLVLVYGFGIPLHHHDLLTHRPALWLCVGAIAVAARHRALAALALGAMLHLLLDSWVGRIDWGWPWLHAPITLVAVPPRFDWWVLSFVLHPTFLLEIAITTLAVRTWRRPCPRK